jgi:hypothetical protein
VQVDGKTMNIREGFMVLRILSVVLGLTAAAQAAAATLDLNLHDDALRATYSTAVGASRGLDLDVGYLYLEDRSEDAHLLHAGLQVAGQNWSKQGNFDIGIGGRVVFVDAGPVDSTHIAFGGRVRFSPAPRVSLGASVYYAPDITSFRDSEEYVEWNLSLDYQMLTQAFVYLGYRKVEIDIENGGTHELDDHLHIGMRLTF